MSPKIRGSKRVNMANEVHWTKLSTKDWRRRVLLQSQVIPVKSTRPRETKQEKNPGEAVGQEHNWTCAQGVSRRSS